MRSPTKSQLKRLSNIFDNVGQVLLGTLVLNPLLNPIDEFNSNAILIVGLTATSLSWWVSLKFERINL